MVVLRCIDAGTTLAGIIGGSLQQCQPRKTKERQWGRRGVHPCVDGWIDGRMGGLQRGEVMAKQGDTR